MIPVFQTIHGSQGNCLQAAFASLLEVDLKDVPRFSPLYWKKDIDTFLKSHGYTFEGEIFSQDFYDIWSTPRDCYQGSHKDKSEIISVENLAKIEGVHGFTVGAVLSANHFKWNETPIQMHAVVCSVNGKIVHDPNDQYKDLKQYPLAHILGFDGLTHVYIIKKVSNENN